MPPQLGLRGWHLGLFFEKREWRGGEGGEKKEGKKEGKKEKGKGKRKGEREREEKETKHSSESHSSGNLTFLIDSLVGSGGKIGENNSEGTD